ncbi:MAG: hypothetical protein IKQ18_01035 [Clostridia bacterium]|nr:hypothetical protein [Clostridia bacterium]
MKKAFIIILILSFALAFAVCAKTAEYELSYVPENIVIDGVMNVGEWDGAVKVSLDKSNTGMWANFYDENSRLPLYACFFYGEDGIYVGADIYDNDVDTKNMHDCFEVAFNPGELIPDGDKLEGLFFTFWLKDEEILMKRHNRFDGDQSGDFEDGAVCKYAMTDHGYTVEALIKWEWLTMSDRPVLNTKTGKYKTGILNKFDYKADGAFTYAIVCYLNGNGDDSSQYRCVYRTVTDPDLAGNFSTATYDIKFTFAKHEETTAVTETETETKTETETETGTEQVTITETEAETTAPKTEKKSASSTLVIILIAVSAVAAVAVVDFLVMLKKRK